MAATTLTRALSDPLVHTRASRRREHRRTTDLTLGKSKTLRVVALVVLVLLSLSWLAPLLFGVVTSFKSETDAAAAPVRWLPENGFTLDAYRAVFANGEVLVWMGNSLLISLAVTAITLAICAMAAYGFSRTIFCGRKTLFAITIASIMVPAQILIVPLFQEMLALRMVDTLAGVILPQVVAPVMVYILKKFFDGIPRELEDAARVDGAGSWRTFWTIVLPLSRSILVAVAIFVFIGAWNNFLWPFLVTNDPDLMTLPVGLATVKSAYGVQYAQTMASMMVDLPAPVGPSSRKSPEAPSSAKSIVCVPANGPRAWSVSECRCIRRSARRRGHAHRRAAGRHARHPSEQRPSRAGRTRRRPRGGRGTRSRPLRAGPRPGGRAGARP